MAADDDEIRHAHMRREQRHLGLGPRGHLIGERIDAQEAVGLREGGDRTGALAGGIGDQAAPALDQRDHDEFGAAELGGNAHRHGRADLGIGARRQAGHPAQHRHDHVVEGEHRRGRKARQDHHRLAVADREAQRLAGLERHAMRDDAGLAEPADDAVGQVARAFRRAAGEHQHVGVRQRAAHRRFELLFVVGNGAEEDCLAAILVDRGRDDRAVGVVDLRGARAPRRAEPVRRRSRSRRPAACARRPPRQCRRPPACRSRVSRRACRRAAGLRRARCRSPHRRRTARETRHGGYRSHPGRPAGCARP
ncbi:hypothetical protein ACVME8_001897 [Bradyrhizobium diazoefficiens]